MACRSLGAWVVDRRRALLAVALQFQDGLTILDYYNLGGISMWGWMGIEFCFNSQNKKEKISLLSGVSGYLQPGELTALMG